MAERRARDFAFGAAAVVAALGFTSLILLLTGTSPLAAFWNIILGSVSPDVWDDVIVSWVPLILVTSGLLVTFTVGLWNIGIEGQIIFGGIFSTWAMRATFESGLPPTAVLALSILAGMAGGALWAALAGVLKTFGGVNEIFGGLGLNFVATALNLWLIFGPWKRPGVASMSGTIPFPETMWMPTITPQSRFSIVPTVLAVLAIVTVYILLKGTHFGLRLKAVGKNPRSSYILGIPTWQHMMASFAICGLLAGAAGAIQVTAVYHRLIPSISSGYGYLGLMVAMLVNYSAGPVVPVALFFAALNVGSIRLPIVLRLDSSLAGVIQGTLVLSVLLAQGFKRRLLSRAKVSS